MLLANLEFEGHKITDFEDIHQATRIVNGQQQFFLPHRREIPCIGRRRVFWYTVGWVLLGRVESGVSGILFDNEPCNIVSLRQD
jgi:hypothetical protein